MGETIVEKIMAKAAGKSKVISRRIPAIWH